MRIRYLVRTAHACFDKATRAETAGEYAIAANHFARAAEYFDRLLVVAPWHCDPDAARVSRIRGAIAARNA